VKRLMADGSEDPTASGGATGVIGLGGIAGPSSSSTGDRNQIPSKVFVRRLQDYIEERPGSVGNNVSSSVTATATDTNTNSQASETFVVSQQ
jgi:hypothetical protein